MPVKAIAPAAAGDPLEVLWTAGHPVAEAAGRICSSHWSSFSDLIGGVACRLCWEEAIWKDRMFAEECDLPLDIDPDPSYIDEIAVEKALRSLDPTSSEARIDFALTEFALTELERHEARRRLAQLRDRRGVRRFACSRAAAARRAGGGR
ncbi:hypothetical protein F4553_005370 [Allocatelliglobosispora scoriae]|uniref:Uncharacterized protein n=1 Tax=Allocatelliglobosispora scoriae TaxID=643052 RepID=A0A841BZ97_9ACTN|nr:hypothetical protein [Allocatelliglobosispora scoriae]MBB5871991.1 hypothetical protein [Allocatelliglobosispora scoriae]